MLSGKRAEKIILTSNTSWYVNKFRIGLVEALKKEGYEVTVVAPEDAYTEAIRHHCDFAHLRMDRSGVNLLRDILLIFGFIYTYWRVRPGLVIHFTVKPVLYGTWAARLLSIPALNNITGLGTAFIKENWVTSLVTWMYRKTLRHSAFVYFQNHDDLDLFVGKNLLPDSAAGVIPATGIDTGYFSPASYPDNKVVTFLLIARLIYDKGIGEFVEAARIVKSRGYRAKFQILGFLDEDNRTAVPQEHLDGWAREGVIEYPGSKDDVRPYIAEADCVALPSYREGLPRTLLEAAAMARPIITTDTVGCREVVEDGINGYLCRVKDAEDLAGKIIKMVSLSPEERRNMGLKGRKKVEREFDEEMVLQIILNKIKQILQ